MDIESIPQDEINAKYKRALQNLVNFNKEFIIEQDKWLEPAKFHYTLSDILLHGKRNMAIEAFRESGKTSLVMIGLPLYRLLNPGQKKLYILLIKRSSNEAAKFIKQISEEMQTNPLFSWVIEKVHQDSSNEGGVFEITTKKPFKERIRIEGKGKTSGVRGALWQNQRPDLVILDDIQNNDDMYSETVLTRDWEWFNSDVMFLSKRGRVFMIGNNLGESCLIEKVMEKKESLGFDTLKIPVLGNEGESMWPAKYSEQDIEIVRKNAVESDTLEVFERELMCRAVSDESRLFPQKFFKYFDPLKTKELSRSCNIYILTDFAVSQKDTADYRVILVLGVNSDGFWFVFDCDYGRWEADEFISRLFAAVRKWKPLVTTFEVHGQQEGYLRQIEGRMSAERTFFRIEPVGVGSKANAKFLQISQLQPKFAQGKIWFPEQASWLPEMISELMAVTKSGKLGKHDDLINALAYGFNENINSPMDENTDIDFSKMPKLADNVI